MGLYQAQKTLHCKGNTQQSEEVTDKTRESICKPYNCYRITVQDQSRPQETTKIKSVQEWTSDMHWHFLKDEIETAKRLMQIAQDLATREIPIKTTRRLPFTPARMAYHPKIKEFHKLVQM